MPDRNKARETAEAKFTLAAQSQGARATADYHADGEATRKKTERLKAQRLAKEAAHKVAKGIADTSPDLKVRTSKKSGGA